MVTPRPHEEHDVCSRDVWRDHDRRFHSLGLTAGVLERARQLVGPRWIIQEDVHDTVIDSRERRLN